MKRSRKLPLSAEDVPPPSRFSPRWMRRPDVPSGDQADGRIGISPSPGEPQRTWWGEIGVFGGGAAIAATLYAVHPDFGAGSLGRWRIAGIAIGLLMIAVGLVAVLRHGVLRTTNKAAVVAVTVIAVGAFAFGVEPIPTTVPDCSTVFGPTLENRGPLYCDEGNGTLVRKSISNVEECPDGSFSYTITVGRRGGKWPGDGWSVEWRTGNTCPLL